VTGAQGAPASSSGAGATVGVYITALPTASVTLNTITAKYDINGLLLGSATGNTIRVIVYYMNVSGSFITFVEGAAVTLPNTGALIRINVVYLIPYVLIADTTNEVVYNVSVMGCLSITQLTGS
jgi:hypothetical protein